MSRRGSAPVTVLGAVLCALLVVPPALAGSLALLVVACLALGFANGMLDVAMNVQGVAVERRIGRPILSRLHALFSLGMLAAGALSVAIATLGAQAALVGVAGVALVVTAVAAPGLQGGDAHVGPAFARPSRALATLSAVAFAALLCEGAVADWSAVHLHDTLGTTKPNAALGLTAFALAMTVARLLGDRLSPPPGLAGAVAATGLLTAALAPTPLIAITGFATAGIGLATLFPVVIRKAGDGASIAAVSTAGYVGLVAGPPLVGALAEATDLRTALAVILGALSLSIVALAR